MSHPSLGLPPRDPSGGNPAAAASLRAGRERLATRAFEAAVAADASLTERHTEAALRRLLRDTATMLDVVARAVAAGDPGLARSWAEMAVPVYRRHGAPMDDLATLAEGLRSVLGSALPDAARGDADAAVAEAIAVFRWHRRLGGDARKRNRLLAFLYKGA